MASNGVFLAAEWRHLAMLNYQVDPSLLLPLVPAGTELDRWNGKVFASLVGFQFLNTRLLGFLPVPLHSNFDEVNLRFYVRREVGGEIRTGVVFAREIVPRWAIAYLARTFYNEQYVALPMAHRVCLNGDHGLEVEYRWRSGANWSGIQVEAEGEAKLPDTGSVEQFISEHYWGYAAQADGGCVEYRVTHPSWKVWHVRHAKFEGDVEELYGKEIAAVLRGAPASAFLADGSAVTVMRGRRL